MRTFNGSTSLAPSSRLLYTWKVPGTGRDPVELRLRQGSKGFLLVHNAMWFDEEIERLDVDRIRDDWGYAPRPPSNHGAGEATDLNATRHPFHVPTRRTFTDRQIASIRKHLQLYDGCVDWGGDWRDPDGMHFEIAPGHDLADCERVARRLVASNARRVQRILKANPGQKKVILS